MATATDTAPRKRAASKRAAATNGKAPARKRAASKTTDDEPVEEKTTKAAEAAEAREARKAARLEKWDDLSNQVFELREEGKGWDEIAEELEMSVGLAQKYLFWHEARQEDGGDIPEATADEVARLRDEEHLSWPRIEVMFDISRQTCWKLYAEAKGDPEAHFSSDIGKGGRYVERDPDEVEARRAARKPASNSTGRRGRPPKFKGFRDETPDEDVMNAVEGKKITWDKTRGGGEDSAVVKEGTMSIVNNKSGRGLQFSDGRKTRTVFVNKIKAVS